MSFCIGLMSGTSADGLDAALIHIKGQALQLTDALCLPYDDHFRDYLRTIALQPDIVVADLLTLQRQLAQHSVSAVQQLLSRNGLQPADIRAIGSHGHTLRHKPQPDGYSWQIDDPSWIAEHTGITCVADFRRRDIAAQGQGAPLVPAFHAACLPAGSMVLNLGGIANLSVLPEAGGTLLGFDTGPGNALMDEWCQRSFQRACDHGGELAAQGQVLPDLLALWLSFPYFQQPPPKSTGRELFRLASFGDLSQADPLDILTTLTELTVCSVADAVRRHGHTQGELLICGGGVHNRYLLQRLQQQLPQHDIASTARHGIDPDWLEAMAFAWLGWQTLNGQPGNAAAVTGARGPRILGGIYPA